MEKHIFVVLQQTKYTALHFEKKIHYLVQHSEV